VYVDGTAYVDFGVYVDVVAGDAVGCAVSVAADVISMPVLVLMVMVMLSLLLVLTLL